jgi:hypothetical protein
MLAAVGVVYEADPELLEPRWRQDAHVQRWRDTTGAEDDQGASEGALNLRHGDDEGTNADPWWSVGDMEERWLDMHHEDETPPIFLLQAGKGEWDHDDPEIWDDVEELFPYDVMVAHMATAEEAGEKVRWFDQYNYGTPMYVARVEADELKRDRSYEQQEDAYWAATIYAQQALYFQGYAKMAEAQAEAKAVAAAAAAKFAHEKKRGSVSARFGVPKRRKVR